MYLHLGQDTVVLSSDIIGIFDLENVTVSKWSRAYLTGATKRGEVINVSMELPKSFVVCDHPYHRQIVYLSPLSSQTLYKRMESDSLLLD